MVIWDLMPLSSHSGV